MVQNATGGPDIVYGQLPAQAGSNYIPEYNQDAAPSIFWGGIATLDSRWPYKPYGGQPSALGWQGATYIPVLNIAPSTASTSIIAAAQAPSTTAALAIATQSTTGITVLSTALTVYPSVTSVPVGAIALDGVPGEVIFRTTGTGGVQIYDPTKASARIVRIQTNNADTGSYKVSGFDIYGYPMTEAISGTTSTTGAVLLGKKAFKFVSSVQPQGGIVSTSVSVGTGDTFGFPVRADGFGDVDINYLAVITSSTGFTTAVTTTATSTTGDVRGTYALQTASNGTNVLQVFVTPRVANLASQPTGLSGVTQA